VERQSDVDPREIRRLVLEQSRRANVGHIGSALSVADILAVVYGGLAATGSHAANRDLFILSKGHAALALYAALHLRGAISADELNTYCADGTLLGVHPERELAGVDFATGSLGHGISVGAGAALGARLRASSARALVLASDAELDEGSTWEGVIFAAHHKLDNLLVIFDMNGQQALGRTHDVLDLGDVPAKFEAFGWQVTEVDGHDTRALRDALDEAPQGRPRGIFASTVAGKGVSFMEGRVEWHYLPMTDDQYRQAMAEVC
jgi:transketolase